MPNRLPDWPRQFLVEQGGRPCLFYVIYGEFGNLPSLSATRYRSAGVPSGFNLAHYDRQQHAHVLHQYLDGYLWDEFSGRNAILADRVRHSQQCLILRGEIEDSPTLNYLRDAVGLITFLLDHGGVAVFDPFMFQWWEPEEWMFRVFQPAGAVPRHHVVILTSEEDAPMGTWFHTRGLRKFGRPDLSIHRVPDQLRDGIIDLCERFIEFQAFGGFIEEGKAIKMKSLPSGMTCHHRGSLEDPDFNNVHIEFCFA